MKTEMHVTHKQQQANTKQKNIQFLTQLIIYFTQHNNNKKKIKKKYKINNKRRDVANVSVDHG